MASASAPANELAKELPASASSLAATSGSKHSGSGGSVSRGRNPGPAAAAAAAAAAASTRAGFVPDKKAERRDYMHQVFISSYVLIRSSLLALALLLSVIMSQVFRVYVLVHGLIKILHTRVLLLLNSTPHECVASALFCHCLLYTSPSPRD